MYSTLKMFAVAWAWACWAWVIHSHQWLWLIASLLPYLLLAHYAHRIEQWRPPPAPTRRSDRSSTQLPPQPGLGASLIQHFADLAQAAKQQHDRDATGKDHRHQVGRRREPE